MGALTERIAADRQLLWLDSTAYAAGLLAGGAAPWLDVDGFVACYAWDG